jgi:hypothetical protein
MLNKKVKRGRTFFRQKGNKKKESKIKVLSNELLAFTLSYIMLVF